MNFLNIFEDRISGIFGSARAPFSFKKLARQAAHEMEEETLVINGQNTAPALYTVLISANDDLLLTQHYTQLTNEISSFVQAQAEKKRYAFVGEPLVRFMVDPELKAGRFSVFAENVDAPTLARLYEEERVYTSGNRVDSSAANSSPQMQRNNVSAPTQINPLDNIAPVANNVVSADPFAAPAVPATLSRDAIAGMGGAAATGAVAGAAFGVASMSSQRVEEPRVIATLVDVSTGQNYPISSTRCILGRERSVADVALRDPNISRRHAELSCTNGAWSIEDLNSTNGTSVNNRRVDRSPLIPGDIITLGLTTLEFRS